MIQKIQLASNNLGFGPEPEPNRIVEQRLTILSDGSASLSRYCYGDGWQYKLASEKTSQIGEKKAAEILSAVEAVFTKGFIPDFVTDIGTWNLTITFDDGSVGSFHGSLLRDDRIEDYGISGKIRRALDDSSVLAFDGSHSMNIWD